MNFVFSIDGPDASGKTLIAQLVAEELRMRYRDKEYLVFSHKMPGGTETGAEIRKILKNPNLTISPLTERLLFAADASEFFHHLLRVMATHENSIHIVDRWGPVTEYMYSLPRGITEEELMSVIRIYLNKKLVVMPDILFLVDVALSDMVSRLHATQRPPCRIEQLGDDYQSRVWKMYNEAISDTQSAARKQCALRAHDVRRLDNTNPSARTLRNVADEAIAAIEDHIFRRSHP
jgi:thymidylate kinase